MSCATSPPSAPEIVEIITVEYRDRPLPYIAWPAFPDPGDSVALDAEGRVVMPLEYWLDVTRYVIDVEAGIDRLEVYRNGEHY